MATIDSTSPYISAYNVNSIHSNTVDKLASGSAVNKASNDPSNLIIANGLQIHERVLAQSIDNASNGIALSNIAQGAINHQKDMLMEIQQLTLKASNDTLNEENKKTIANQIDKLLQGYEAIADSTSYNGETLLKTTGDSSDDLSIVGEDKIVSIYKADTMSISQELKNLLTNFATDSTSRENFLNTLNQGIDKLASFASDFGSASNALESSVRNQLTQATNTANAKSTIADIDYTKEVTNFSKSNLLTQLGYLMQTQANAHQQRTIEILK